MKIRFNLMIIIFIILFFLTKQIEIYCIIMFFSVLHELGHTIAGIILGFKPSAIEINPFGLSISFESKVENYNKKIKNTSILTIKKMIIAISGPIINLICILICLAFNEKITIGFEEVIIYSNIIIGVFNLIPIYPLDGGRILKNLLHIFVGLDNTYSYTNLISNISIIILTFFSSICILYVKNVAILLIIGYLWYLVINENKLYNQRLRICEVLKKELS